MTCLSSWVILEFILRISLRIFLKEMFQRLSEAYSILSDPDKRSEYDQLYFDEEDLPPEEPGKAATLGRELVIWLKDYLDIVLRLPGHCFITVSLKFLFGTLCRSHFLKD